MSTEFGKSEGYIPDDYDRYEAKIPVRITEQIYRTFPGGEPIRTDVYSNGERINVHIAWAGDKSPSVFANGNMPGSVYDPRCGWCYIHACHSLNEHNQELEKAKLKEVFKRV